jgi:hypothetical protein
MTQRPSTTIVEILNMGVLHWLDTTVVALSVVWVLLSVAPVMT